MEMMLGHGEAAGGAVVRGKDLRDGTDLGFLIDSEFSIVEVERGEGPEMAPPGGEGSGTSTILGGKEEIISPSTASGMPLMWSMPSLFTLVSSCGGPWPRDSFESLAGLECMPAVDAGVT